MTTIRFTNDSTQEWFVEEYQFSSTACAQAAELCLEMGNNWDWEEEDEEDQ